MNSWGKIVIFLDYFLLAGSVERRFLLEFVRYRSLLKIIAGCYVLLQGEQKTAAAILSSDPICTVTRTIYVPSPRPDVSPVIKVQYLGKGFRLRELCSQEGRSDLTENTVVRFSDDNGRSWTAFAPTATDSPSLRQNGNFRDDESFAVNFDPTSHQTIEMVLRRIFLGEPGAALDKRWKGEKKFYDHMFYRMSVDDGRTWTPQQPIVFEAGAPFNPKDWANPAYLQSNNLYGSYDVTLLRDGRIAYPATVAVPYQDDAEDRKVCANAPKYALPKPGYVDGVCCFFGKWNQQKQDYDWSHSGPVFVPRRFSTRGLTEPVVAELKNGTLLLDMRGANDGLDPVKFPGRKWMSISRDGGRNWSGVTDLRYDTGEQFYAPSSLSRLIRSHKTGKLYWIGNISRKPPKGNRPRYPLYIAEMDEEIPALKKSTLTIIDDRSPQDAETVQFSNFSLLENRETLNLEIYLSRFGERSGHTFSANSYKYVLAFH
jgi:hypothetical protein